MTKKKAAVIGVALDLGGNRRGVDMGPSAIRVTRLVERIGKLGYDVVDRGDVDVPLPEERDPGNPRMKYGDCIRLACAELCRTVHKSMKEGRLPVVLGGDHSIAMGSVAGVAKHFRGRKKRIGLIWFDAHGDMNTPATTKTGNVHGMPLAHVLGIGDAKLAGLGGFKPKVHRGNVALVGIRDLDKDEKKAITESGVTLFTMKDIDRRGMASVVEDAVKVASRDTAGIHVSFDADVMDPSVAPGVGTPKRGGIVYRESHLCLEIIADSKLMTSLDMVEVNPILDDRNKTAEVACELILSALGKRIF